MEATYDFSGWATKNGLRCTDGVTICQGAFDGCDGKKVPLVWNHQHSNPENVLGQVVLEARPEGMYAYGKFNDTEHGKTSKTLVHSGDIVAMSICANGLKRDRANRDLIRHGEIREVSLVLAGANPGALIDTVICHGDEVSDEAIIYTGEEIELYHSDEDDHSDKLEHNDEANNNGEKAKEEPNMAEENSGKTVKDVFDSMTEEQKNVCYAMIGQALEDAGVDTDEGDEGMKHNVFDDDNDYYDGDGDFELSHEAEMEIIGDAKRYGSMKDSVLEHSEQYGITNIDLLFPDYHKIQTEPTIYDKDFSWASDVMSNVHHVPYGRIKSMYADITADEARAKGYTKGKKKLEEVFSLLKRTTDPQTVYKKQKLDRDDVISITDFSVVSWMKKEMRMKLDQELARAFLIGDGRRSMEEDKISEDHIRPVWTDDELYTIHYKVEGINNEDTPAKQAAAVIDAAVLAQDDYRGNSIPTLYMRKDLVSRALLLKDTQGNRLYKDVNELATAMLVKKIVRVEVMTGLKRNVPEEGDYGLLGIIVNMNDYYVGTDKGGQISMFDDFDIDFNQMKYLMEVRCSGALVNPKTAIVLESFTPSAP